MLLTNLFQNVSNETVIFTFNFSCQVLGLLCQFLNFTFYMYFTLGFFFLLFTFLLNNSDKARHCLLL